MGSSHSSLSPNKTTSRYTHIERERERGVSTAVSSTLTGTKVYWLDYQEKRN